MATEFAPGSRVHLVSNINKKGTIVNAPVKMRGASVKQKVLFDDGECDYRLISGLEADAAQSLTLADVLESGHYGSAEDLRSVITKRRLSGLLENLIYSLNVTNTDFYAYQFLPLLTFFESNKNSILIADEVGLGKTIEAGLIWTELRMRHRGQRLLVVAPAALCGKWQSELLSKFGVDAQILKAPDLLNVIQKIQTTSHKRGAYIISLQSLRPPRGWEDNTEKMKHEAAEVARLLANMTEGEAQPLFDLLILDEAHHIRNQDTKQNVIIKALRPLCAGTLFLSATPIQTSDSNLYTLLNLIDKDTFIGETQLTNIIYIDEPLIKLVGLISQNTIDEAQYKELLGEFARRRECFGFNNPFLDKLLSEDWCSKLSSISGRLELVRELNFLNPLSQVMTRSLKRFVQSDRPRVERDPSVVTVSMTAAEQHFYDEITFTIRRFCTKHNAIAGFLESNLLRQLSSCPSAALAYWRDAVPDAAATEDESDEENAESSSEAGPLKQALHRAAVAFKEADALQAEDSKFTRFLETIRRYRNQYPGEKLLVFTFFKRTLAYLKQRLADEGIEALCISGDNPRQERDEVIERFEHGNVPVLLSTEVASEGIDLQFVSCLINYDLPWNPAKIEQRIGRIDRIGQKAQKILIYSFIYEETVEYKIYDRLFERLEIFKRALGVTEKVLGEQIRHLTQALLSHELTQEEEDKAIEQTKFAIENCRQHTKDIEDYSLVYSAMQKRIEACRDMGRYVVNEDLYNIVADFCRADPYKSKLIEIEPNRYQLQLSADAEASFGKYLENDAQNADQTRLLMSERPEIEFENREGPLPHGVERINQTHPLIRFIVASEKKDPCSTSALEYLLPLKEAALFSNIKDGLYAYRVKQWSFKGCSSNTCLLSYAAVNVQTGEALSADEAELLINNAARSGESLRRRLDVTDALLDAHDETADELELRFKNTGNEIRDRKKQEALFRVQQYKSQMAELQQKYDQRIDSERYASPMGREGRLAQARKKYQDSKRNLETRICAIEQQLDEWKETDEHVSAGVINLRR